MELSKYDKLINTENKIRISLQKGQILRSKALKIHYNLALNSMRKLAPTDIPFYAICDFTNIYTRSWMVDYEQECGFCGSRENLETVHMSTGNIRTIRICNSETCKEKSRLYILFKKGWIKPEFKDFRVFSSITAHVSSIISSIYSSLF
ncbi:MAG: hypothetical protein KAT43_02695 [Nanoarchaeota archaeon]|nr:hypothetical protein [Nanoarchaeota archaeon]